MELPFENGQTDENYPVGLVGDIKCHCIHYKTFEEAREKWETRKKRIISKRIVCTLTDQNECTPELVERFMKLPYPKIFFTSDKQYSGYKILFSWIVKYIRKSIMAGHL